MIREFTLEYWIDDGWYVGKLKEVPGIFSQGETLEELEENIRDAYSLMLEDDEEELQVGAKHSLSISMNNEKPSISECFAPTIHTPRITKEPKFINSLD